MGFTLPWIWVLRLKSKGGIEYLQRCHQHMLSCFVEGGNRSIEIPEQKPEKMKI